MIIAHYGLYDTDARSDRILGSAPDFISMQDAARFARDCGVKTIICGHRHDLFVRNIGGVTLVSLGALAPRTFREQGFDYGNVAFLNEQGAVDVYKEAVPGVRFVTQSDVINRDISRYLCLTDDESLSSDPRMSRRLAWGSIFLLAGRRKCKAGRSGGAFRGVLSSREAVRAAVLRSVRRGEFPTMPFGAIQKALAIYAGSLVQLMEEKEGSPLRMGLAE